MLGKAVPPEEQRRGSAARSGMREERWWRRLHGQSGEKRADLRRHKEAADVARSRAGDLKRWRVAAMSTTTWNGDGEGLGVSEGTAVWHERQG